MRVNPVLDELGDNPLAAVHMKARSMRDAGVDLVDFSIGDPREPTPPFIRQALIDAVPEVSQYPTVHGLKELREAIAGYIDRRFGVQIDPDAQVIPTTGSKEAVFSSHFAFVDPSAEVGVIRPTPGYPIYRRGARLAGAIDDAVELSDDFVFTADMVPDAWWRRAAMVWICTPHNPAGSVMTATQIGEFLERARAEGALLCSDECYADLYEADPPASVLEVAGGAMEGALSFLSLSKRSGMTGYRSGAIVGDADAIATLRRLRTATGTAPTEFGQAASAAAWSDDAHAAERREIFNAKRAVIAAGFRELGYEIVGSTAGLYLWVRVGDDLDVADRLLDGGVIVSPGRAFGHGGAGYIRLALVPTLEACTGAVEVVLGCLEES